LDGGPFSFPSFPFLVVAPSDIVVRIDLPWLPRSFAFFHVFWLLRFFPFSFPSYVRVVHLLQPIFIFHMLAKSLFPPVCRQFFLIFFFFVCLNFKEFNPGEGTSTFHLPSSPPGTVFHYFSVVFFNDAAPKFPPSFSLVVSIVRLLKGASSKSWPP